MRRAPGEGSIYRHGKGWRVRVRRDGRERTWSLPTRAAAVGKLREIQMDGRDPTVAPRSAARLTVNGWAEQWLDSVALDRPKTVGFYRAKLGRILPVLGGVKLEALRVRDINRALADVLASGVSRTTVHHIHSTLSTMLRAAVREGVIAHSPMEHAKRPERSQHDATVLRPHQIKRFVAEAERDQRIGPLVLLALATGARKSELLALTWDDIDLDRGEMLITKSHRREKGRVIADTPKSRYARRALALDPRIADVMRSHQRRQAEKRLAVVSWLRPDLVFTSDRGGPLTHDNRTVFEAWKALRSRAGVPSIRFHDLRHTVGTGLVRQVGVKAAQEALGHSTPATTLRWYMHSTPGDIERGLRGMADQMWSPNESPIPVTDVLQSATE